MITLFEKFYKSGSIASYSAIVLDSESKLKLLNEFVYNNPEFEEWIKYADHMTICMGTLPEHLRRYWLDEEVELIATEIGISDKSIAVKVEGFFTVNKTNISNQIEDRVPHITLAINPIDATPKDSNFITDWKEIENIKLRGVIKEV